MKNEKLTYVKLKDIIIKNHLRNMSFKRKENNEKEDLKIANNTPLCEECCKFISK